MNDLLDDHDAFVETLRGLPVPPLPSAWRAEVLAAAGSALATAAPAVGRLTGSARIVAWLWPHPLAYAGLAAAWVLILGIRLLTDSAAPAPMPSLLVAQTSGAAAGELDASTMSFLPGQTFVLNHRAAADLAWQ